MVIGDITLPGVSLISFITSRLTNGAFTTLEIMGNFFSNVGKFSETTRHDAQMILLPLGTWAQNLSGPDGDVLFIVTTMAEHESFTQYKESPIISYFTT